MSLWFGHVEDFDVVRRLGPAREVVRREQHELRELPVLARAPRVFEEVLDRLASRLLVLKDVELVNDAKGRAARGSDRRQENE